MRLGPVAAGRCRRRIHLDHDPDADRTRQRAPDPGLDLRRRNLAGHRSAIHDRLAATMTLFEDVPPTDGERPTVIWAPRLVFETRFATPDLLLLDTDGGYLPVLIRGHRTTDPGSGAELTGLGVLESWAAASEQPWERRPQNGSRELSASSSAHRLAENEFGAPVANGGTASWAVARRLPIERSTTKRARAHYGDALALAHVYRLLQSLGLASHRTLGGIIGFGGPSMEPDWSDGDVLVWHRLDASANGSGRTVLEDYDERFADRLRVATAAAERRPALAHPSRISECRLCPWWPVCGPELEAAHDVSLLVAGSDVEILRDAGAATYDDVAQMSEAEIAALPLTGIPAGEARIRARAMGAGVPLVRRGIVDPVRADVELDVDMESYLDDGAYLWGTYLSGAPVPGFAAGYRPFVTWERLDSDAAATNFVNFWEYLSAIRAACVRAGRTFAAYCYSRHAEERWLYGTPARFPDHTGMPTRQEVATFCASEQWVDLYREIKRLFVVPGSLRLKAIAPVAGFAWRDPEPGGENSMAWYRIATGRDGASHDDIDAHRDRILRYNEDDVLATLRLRQWMSEQSDAMPTVAQLDARFDTAAAR